MLGFVFYNKSPRYIRLDRAKEIIDTLSQEVEVVALFVNEKKETVADTISQIKRIDLLQFHGNETLDYCNAFNKRVIKAIRVKDQDSIRQMSDYKVNFFLLDTFNEDVYGGSGKSFDWQLAKEAKRMTDTPIILSGGLNPENVKDAIKAIAPYAVDVSSGVERSPGRKNPELIKDFIANVKNAADF